MASLLALIIFSFLLIHHTTLIPLTQVAALVVAQEYYPKERDALLLLRDSVSSTANLHSNWTGPPCTGNRTRWAGIACFNNHVVHLVLESIDMAGSLPPTFLQDVVYLSKVSFRNNSLTGYLPRLGSLVYLQFVFLSHNLFSSYIPMEYAYTIPSLERMELQQNKLHGEIPPFDQPNLIVLNVSYNDLLGQIPQTPVLISMPPSAYQGNPHLCGKPLSRPCPVPYVVPSPSPTDIAPVVPSPSTAPSSSNSQQRRKLKLWVILVIAIGPSLVVPFISMLFLLWYRRRRHRPRKGGGDQDSGTYMSIDI